MNKVKKQEEKKIGFTGIFLGTFAVFFGLVMLVAGVNSIINGTDDNRMPYDWAVAIGGALLCYGGYYMIRNNHEFTLKKTIEKGIDGPLDPLP